MPQKLLKFFKTENIWDKILSSLLLFCIYKRVFKDKVKKLQKRHNVYVYFHHKFNISMTKIPLDSIKMSTKIFCKDNICILNRRLHWWSRTLKRHNFVIGVENLFKYNKYLSRLKRKKSSQCSPCLEDDS